MIRKPLAATASALAFLCAASSAIAGVKYSYDSAGRLVRAEYSSGVTILYSYDAAGNRREITTTQVPNRSPVAVNDSATVIASDTVDIQVRANDSDPDRNPLTITAVSAVAGGGTATIMGGGTHIRYVAPSAHGAKSFTYTVSDGRGGTATATVNVTVSAATPVNRAPVAVNDSTTVVASGAVDILVRANDSDPDGDTLTVTAVSAVAGGGAATIMGGGTHVHYVAPFAGGAKSFTYTISDGKGGSATATVTITVSPPNSAPIANHDEIAIEAGSDAVIMVLSNDHDPDGDPLTIVSTTTPLCGTAQIAPGGSYIVYTAPGTKRDCGFSYTISDGRGGTASAPVQITVYAPGTQPPINQRTTNQPPDDDASPD